MGISKPVASNKLKQPLNSPFTDTKMLWNLTLEWNLTFSVGIANIYGAGTELPIFP